MTEREVYQRARELIAQGWTQGVAARDASGREVWPDSDKAVTFCALGAVTRVAVGLYPDRLYAALPQEFNSIANFNDAPGRTQAEVLALFDRAIESCGG